MPHRVTHTQGEAAGGGTCTGYRGAVQSTARRQVCVRQVGERQVGGCHLDEELRVSGVLHFGAILGSRDLDERQLQQDHRLPGRDAWGVWRRRRRRWWAAVVGRGGGGAWD